MIIGVPKEIKPQEYRVGLPPSAAYQLIRRGHEVVVERQAGGKIVFISSVQAEMPMAFCVPYGAAKAYAFYITKNYRESYNMFACNGILFNHESPIRGETFVTRKITRAAAKVSLGLQKKLYLGNIDAERDWGHAKDYVEGMWLMLQQKQADDFVLATGKKISVRKFIELAFAETGIKIEWKGKAEDEKGINVATGETIIEIDKKYFRPAEVDLLVGDASKANKQLGWKPKYSVEDLVKEMVKCDVQLFERDKYLKQGGHKIFDQHE